MCVLDMIDDQLRTGDLEELLSGTISPLSGAGVQTGPWFQEEV